MSKPTFGSLFAGIGGLDLGLERAGFECKWQVEIDDYANRVLKKHWPDVPRFRDVKEFPPTEGVEPVDLICGGFPCQNISSAGKKDGINGTKSQLFYEVTRIVRILRPKYILLENVSALLARGMGEVLGELASIGFDAEWHCIPAASVGAPHIRDRVFIFAYPQSERWREKREHCERPEKWITSGSKILADTNSKRRCSRQARCKDAANAWQSPRCEEYGFWDIEPAVGRVADGIPRRVDRLRCLGNAVVPQVAEYIGGQIIKSM